MPFGLYFCTVPWVTLAYHNYHFCSGMYLSYLDSKAGKPLNSARERELTWNCHETDQLQGTYAGHQFSTDSKINLLCTVYDQFVDHHLYNSRDFFVVLKYRQYSFLDLQHSAGYV